MSLSNKIIIGTNFDDTFNYSTSTKSLYVEGHDGNDSITTGSGNDLIFAGKGNDFVSAGSGNDIVDGGSGDDSLYGDNGNDILYGGSGDNQLFGGNGNDLLVGGNQFDDMTGGAGNDLLYGAGGNDLANYSGRYNDYSISATWGIYKIVDSVSGRDGTDYTYDVEQFNFRGLILNANQLLNTVITNLSGTPGDDTLIAPAGFTSIDGLAGNDTVDFSNFTSPVDVQLNVAYNSNYGSGYLSNIEKVIGSSYDDTLFGTLGNDTIMGGAGNDMIRGFDGADIITGGAGDDVMYSNPGDSDIFRFNTTFGGLVGEGHDTILGIGTDDTLAFSGIPGLNNGFKLFILNLATSVVDNGLGNDVVITFNNGDNITLDSAGTGTITDMVSLNSVYHVGFF